jgi:CTP synthase
VVEYARHVLGLPQASSTEMDPLTPDPVIALMADQKDITQKGGTMRLGAYTCELKRNSRAAKAYGRNTISERHRHRFEFNNEYLARFEDAGMSASGINPDTGLVEVIELPKTVHPWFVGGQFHPELKSTVENPHPLFVRFVKAAIQFKKGL